MAGLGPRIVTLAALAPRANPRASNPPAGIYLATLAESGRRAQVAALRTIAEWLCPGADVALVPWEDLRYQHVALVRERLVAAHYAPATANRWLAALRGVARQAWLLGLMPGDAYERIRQVPPVRGRREPAGRALSIDEVRALLAAASPRDRAAVALMYGAGLRVAEAAGLWIERVDLGRRVLRVLGKGNAEREVPLARWVVEALEALYRVRGCASGPVLQGPDGRALHPNSVASALERAAARAGVRDVSPHDLRRTFVTALLAAGHDVALVQALAGHADPRTTARYDRRTLDARRPAVEGLEP